MSQMVSISTPLQAALDDCNKALASGQYLVGLHLARTGRQAALDQNDERLYAEASSLEAIHLARSGAETQARELAQSILSAVDSFCSPRRAIEIRNIISRCYVNLGEAVNALPYALESLKRSQALNDDTMLAWAYCRLGATYGSLLQMDRSTQALEKAIEYADKTSDNEVKFGTYQNLANNLRWSIDFKSQIQSIQSLSALKTKAIAVLAKTIEYTDGLALRQLYAYRTEVGLYAICQDAPNLSSALQRYEFVSHSLNNSLHQFIARIHRAHLMLLEGKATLAAEFIEQELNPQQEKMGDASTQSELLRLMHQVYKTTGEHLKALTALEQINREYLTQVSDLLLAQSQLLLGEIEVVDAQQEAKSWRERSEKSAMKMEQERRAARQDALTGLTNRRAFDEDMISRLQQQSLTPLTQHALAMIDVDHFKVINDTYGHEVGDQVLRSIGQGLQESIRGQDKVYRYGGEEFVVLLNVENQNDLLDFCERTRLYIAQLDWSVQLGLQLDRVTVSIGATLISSDDQAKAIVIRADKAMYLAKQEGRNLTRLAKA
jgi:diguanylate cyclase (GGDEF)-like protein